MRGCTLTTMSRWYLPQLLDRPWAKRAACIRHPRLPWTKDRQPTQDDRLAMAQICGECPVLEQCAAYALTGDNGDGVDGGFYAGVWIPWSTYYTGRKIDRTQAVNELRLLVRS